MFTQGKLRPAAIDSSSFLTIRIQDLTSQQLPDGPFTSIGHLLAAEEALDAMSANGVHDAEYLDIERRAKSFIRKHPELLTSPWIRPAGAVFDLIEGAREAALQEQEESFTLEGIRKAA